MSKTERAYTRMMAEYVRGLAYDDLPETVIQSAKEVILDTTGVLLAASSPKYQASKIVTGFVRALGGEEESTVVGSGFKTSCANAALANGTMADNIELDDSHPVSGAHVAAVVVPAALAMGEREGIDGRILITSVVVGYDVDCRIAIALNPSSLYGRGFHPSAIGGCFGATASAGKVLNLSLEELLNGFGLAGCQASGLMAWETEPTQMSKSFQIGIAARNGVTATLLAKMGFVGPPAILEGEYNLFGAFSDAPCLEALTEDLGTRFEITLTGLKQHACCRFLHASLDAFLQVVRERDIRPEDIEEVTVRIPQAGVPVVDGNELPSHNVQYIVAVAARDRKVLVDHIYEDMSKDPLVQEVSRRVKVEGDPELEKVLPGRFSEPAVVEVRTKEGNSFVGRAEYAKGDPENPMTPEEIEEKFISLATTVLSPARAREIAETVHELERVENVARLADLLRG